MAGGEDLFGPGESFVEDDSEIFCGVAPFDWKRVDNEPRSRAHAARKKDCSGFSLVDLNPPLGVQIEDNSSKSVHIAWLWGQHYKPPLPKPGLESRQLVRGE